MLCFFVSTVGPSFRHGKHEW